MTEKLKVILWPDNKMPAAKVVNYRFIPRAGNVRATAKKKMDTPHTHTQKIIDDIVVGEHHGTPAMFTQKKKKHYKNR